MILPTDTILSIVNNARLPYIELEDDGCGFLEAEDSILIEDDEDYHLAFDLSIRQSFSSYRGNYNTPASTSTNEPHIDIYNINVLSDLEVKLTAEQIELAKPALHQKIIAEL